MNGLLGGRCNRGGSFITGASAAILFMFGATDVHAWTLKTLHSFCADANCADGAQPLAGLVRDAAGNLYGTTEIGGDHQDGVVFELSPTGDTWSHKVLHSFCYSCGDGAFPMASLILDISGNLYGTTASKGPDNRCGTVFRLSPDARGGNWKEKILHVFSCQTSGQATSALDYQGKETGAPYDGVSLLYGTTESGGVNGGTAYSLVPDGGNWKHTVVYEFCRNGNNNCPDGRWPQSDLIMDRSGSIYGMTSLGGSNDAGIIYQLHPGKGARHWRQTVLYNFCQVENCTDGSAPVGALVMNQKGDLFGTSNGPGDEGNIFALRNERDTWKEKTLHLFDAGNCDGYNPEAGLLLDASGTMYGTTSIGGCPGDGGSVFSLKGKQYSTLYAFCSQSGCADGDASLAPVIQDTSGNLYGTTSMFGGNGDGGTVFELIP